MGGDEFNPERQITRSSLRCPSLELTLRRAGHEERVCHPASLRHTCTRAEREHSPHEVRSYFLNETVEESFNFDTSASAFSAWTGD